MAYADIRLSGANFATRMREIYTDLQDRAAARRVYRQTVHELSELSDRELADLGIARSNISSVAREHAEL